MELYRVLLVDDEEDIREGISRKMDWLGLGFSLVGEAANGQDALELAESLRPDVILTDIKMPLQWLRIYHKSPNQEKDLQECLQNNMQIAFSTKSTI